MRKTVFVFVLMAIISSVFGVKLVFWTAPNALQEAFWKEIVAEYKKVKPDVEIVLEVIPAAGSSEEAILSALAAGRAPDMSENIFSGFAAQLADIGAIYPLDEFKDDFWKLVETRKMKNIIEKWSIKGRYYVFPIYSNPMLFWWRGDSLKSIGYTAPPRTYSQIYDIGKKVVSQKKYAMQVVSGRNWWDRWFDFITYYYAATGGKSYIDISKRRATFNDDAGKAIATFMYEMFKNKYTAVEMGTNPFYTGALLGKITGPWEIEWARETFPKVIDNIWIAPPPVPDSYPKDKPVYTVADTKGIVIYQTSKYKKEAFEFISWVFSRVQSDQLWIEKTKMPPAREDLSTNPAFQKYMNDRFFKAYAEAVPYAVPPSLIDKTIDVQQAMTTYLIEPIMYQKGNVETILNNAIKEINKILF